MSVHLKLAISSRRWAWLKRSPLHFATNRVSEHNASINNPDTLFFNRRLKLRGNTKLGLELKNFLDALEPKQEFNLLFNGLNQFLSKIDHFYILKQRFF
jgi:hypothetical protein